MNSQSEEIISLNSSIQQVTLWARYKRIQDIITSLMLPLVVLIGSNQNTSQIKKIILDHMKYLRQ